MERLAQVRWNAILASQLAGLILPLRKLDGADAGAGPGARRLSVGSAMPGVRWPGIEAALRWLYQRRLLSAKTIAGVITKSQLQARAWGTIVDDPLMDRLRDAVEESVAKGEGHDEWSERIGREISVAKHVEENIQRTATHRAYYAGQDSLLDDSSVGELFPYYAYYATRDTRVRPEHAKMDGKVAHKDSPLGHEMRRLIDDYNCRCTLAPLSREDAVGRGIDDDRGWREPERKTEPAAPEVDDVDDVHE